MSSKFQKFQDEGEDLDLEVGENSDYKQNNLQHNLEQNSTRESYQSQYDINGSQLHLHQSNSSKSNNTDDKRDLQEFDSFEGQNNGRDVSESESTEMEDRKIKNRDPTVSKALFETLQRLEQPIKYLLVYQISFLMLKLSRIILILGLLIKLFFEMTCQKSSIHSLLLCAFFRDVISGILDLQLIFKIYEIRYKMRRGHIDEQMKQLGRELIRSKRADSNTQLILGRFTSKEAIHSLQSATSYEMFELQSAIGYLMPYLAYFMKILKYSYHFLFLISIVFIIRYDDEQFCHVYEKYTIIYLFLPIYIIFLVFALCLTFLGLFCTIILLLLVVLLGKYIHNKHKHKQQLQINQLKAYNLGYVTYTTIQHELLNNQCAICLNKYLPDDSISILKCSPLHHFHYSCLQKCILLKGKCPSCHSDKII